MKPTRHLLASALLALSLAGPALAEEKNAPESDFNAYKELAQVKLDAAKESLQKDVAALGTRVDNQDKRISDINTWLTGFSTVISVALAAIGLFGYFSVKSRARDEAATVAQEEAPKTVKTWLAAHEAELRRRISEAEQATQTAREHIATLEAEIAQLRAQAAHASTHIHAEQNRVTTEANKAAEAMRLIAEQMSKPDVPAAPIPAEFLAALERASAALYEKEESEYTFDDWNRRAYAAFGENKKKMAADAWRKAAEIPNAPADAAAEALFNAGFALGQLGRFDEAITTYDLIEIRYANDTTPAVRDLVAKARNDKGFALQCRAKTNWTDVSQRQADLNSATRLFEQAEAELNNHPLVLGNRAYCAHLRGEPLERVRPMLEQALKDGGERIYKTTLDDLAIHPIPEDAVFRTLLDEVWAAVRGDVPPKADGAS